MMLVGAGALLMLAGLVPVGALLAAAGLCTLVRDAVRALGERAHCRATQPIVTGPLRWLEAAPVPPSGPQVDDPVAYATACRGCRSVHDWGLQNAGKDPLVRIAVCACRCHREVAEPVNA